MVKLTSPLGAKMPLWGWVDNLRPTPMQKKRICGAVTLLSIKFFFRKNKKNNNQFERGDKSTLGWLEAVVEREDYTKVLVEFSPRVN